MSSEFDEVAKAVAKNMPRRRVLKLFAGGVAAVIGTAVAGGSTAAQPNELFSFGSLFCEPNVNDTTGTQQLPIFLNGNTFGLPGFQGPFFFPNRECEFVNGNEGLWDMFDNNSGF